MKAEDTVIKQHKYAAARYMGDRFLKVLIQQADISFRAGVEEGWKQAKKYYQITKKGDCDAPLNCNSETL